jgi:hypothetical protein
MTEVAETTVPRNLQSILRDREYIGSGNKSDGTPGQFLTTSAVAYYTGHAYAVSSGALVHILPASGNDQHSLTVGVFDGSISNPPGSAALTGDGVFATNLAKDTAWFLNSVDYPVTAAYIDTVGYFVNGESVANSGVVSGVGNYYPKAGWIVDFDAINNLVCVKLGKTA